jgi:hypothetical protein
MARPVCIPVSLAPRHAGRALEIMIPPTLRIIIGLAAILYCASRLVAAYRIKVCVTFLGRKYYRAESKVYYWLVIFAHFWLSLALILNIVRDFRLL